MQPGVAMGCGALGPGPAGPAAAAAADINRLAGWEDKVSDLDQSRPSSSMRDKLRGKD